MFQQFINISSMINNQKLPEQVSGKNTNSFAQKLFSSFLNKKLFDFGSDNVLKKANNPQNISSELNNSQTEILESAVDKSGVIFNSVQIDPEMEISVVVPNEKLPREFYITTKQPGVEKDSKINNNGFPGSKEIILDLKSDGSKKSEIKSNIKHESTEYAEIVPLVASDLKLVDKHTNSDIKKISLNEEYVDLEISDDDLDTKMNIRMPEKSLNNNVGMDIKSNVNKKDTIALTEKDFSSKDTTGFENRTTKTDQKIIANTLHTDGKENLINQKTDTESRPILVTVKNQDFAHKTELNIEKTFIESKSDAVNKEQDISLDAIKDKSKNKASKQILKNETNSLDKQAPVSNNSLKDISININPGQETRINIEKSDSIAEKNISTSDKVHTVLRSFYADMNKANTEHVKTVADDGIENHKKVMSFSTLQASQKRNSEELTGMVPNKQGENDNVNEKNRLNLKVAEKSNDPKIELSLEQNDPMLQKGERKDLNITSPDQKKSVNKGARVKSDNASIYKSKSKPELQSEQTGIDSAIDKTSSKTTQNSKVASVFQSEQKSNSVPVDEPLASKSSQKSTDVSGAQNSNIPNKVILSTTKPVMSEPYQEQKISTIPKEEVFVKEPTQKSVTVQEQKKKSDIFKESFGTTSQKSEAPNRQKALNDQAAKHIQSNVSQSLWQNDVSQKSKAPDTQNVLNDQAVTHIKSDVSHSLWQNDVSQKRFEADVVNIENNSIKGSFANGMNNDTIPTKYETSERVDDSTQPEVGQVINKQTITVKQTQDISKDINNHNLATQNYIKPDQVESQKRKIETEKDVKIKLDEAVITPESGSTESKNKKGYDFQQNESQFHQKSAKNQKTDPFFKNEEFENDLNKGIEKNGIASNEIIAAKIPLTKTTMIRSNNSLQNPQIIELSRQINDGVSILQSNIETRLTINTDVEKLGTIKILMTQKNENTEIVIHTQSEQSKMILENSLPELRQNLEQGNTQVSEIRVLVDDNTQQRQAYRDKNSARNKKWKSSKQKQQNVGQIDSTKNLNNQGHSSIRTQYSSYETIA